MKRLFVAVATVPLLASLAAAQAVKVDPGLPAYQKTSGVSGNINSVGSDTMNNMMTLWAEAFPKLYPNVKVQVEGKGSSTAPPALIAGTAQFGPMSRAMRATEIDQFESKYGYKPTQIRTSYDALAVYVNKDNPLEKLTLAQVDAAFSKTPPPRLQAERHHVGPARAHRRLGEPADQPLRPQLRLRHLRLLQGARPQQRRLQGHGQGAAGLGLGGAGRHRGPLRHGLQRHRLQDFRREGRPPGRQGDGALLGRELRGREVSGKYPLNRFLYIYINRAPGKPLDPLVKEFVKFIFSKEGQEVVVKDGYLPLPAEIAKQELAKLE